MSPLCKERQVNSWGSAAECGRSQPGRPQPGEVDTWQSVIYTQPVTTLWELNVHWLSMLISMKDELRPAYCQVTNICVWSDSIIKMFWGVFLAAQPSLSKLQIQYANKTENWPSTCSHNDSGRQRSWCKPAPLWPYRLPSSERATTAWELCWANRPQSRNQVHYSTCQTIVVLNVCYSGHELRLFFFLRHKVMKVWLIRTVSLWSCTVWRTLLRQNITEAAGGRRSR